ncbi:hypothetical protein B4U79_08325 [Dinothrombium tinctorium]|uniref:C2H2-type domain-containing protein n=1 Tax=Dinothrombium tinctorium TaxID=1965070 RepID=A0A3S3SGY2_9ACAR|nr:hypothetical protein B4U79_08325 [Dinothrombium tinctorium]
MAVFLVNTCKFKGCGITFPTLTDLIRHIEETHLDFDSQAIDTQNDVQQPTCLPISYILRVFSANEYNANMQRKESVPINQLKSKLGQSLSPVPSVTSTTPTGSEMEEDIYESESEESSIDSWSNRSTEGDSSHSILKILSTNSVLPNDEHDKPYVCHINGCKKRYRNANGLKYHNKSAHNNCGHKKEPFDATKIYKCHCGKVYKTPHGLKNHCTTQHPNQAKNSPVVVRSNPNVKMGKDSVLATFVRMKSMPSTAINAPSSQATVQGLPLLITAQSEVMIKKEPEASAVKDEINSVKQANVESKEIVTNKNCPVIKAPTLQQHLLSPIVTKAATKC